MSKFNHAKKDKKGFTLIELLIVIGVLGILAGIILVAVDPAKRLKQARDARRFSEVNGLLNAILNYTVDEKGKLPLAMRTATNSQAYVLGTGITGCDAQCLDGSTILPYEECLDLSSDLVDEYIAEIPVDPAGSHATNTGITYDSTYSGYYITRTANGRVEVGSCNAEIESVIKIKR